MDVLVVTLIVGSLALILGLVLGFGAGAYRMQTLFARRKAATGASAVLAMLLPETLPTRSSSDILAGRITLMLGGIAYELPVKSRRASREWVESLDVRFHGLADALEVADVPEILRFLAAHADVLYDLLVEYAGPGVLPERDSPLDNATEAEILHATLEVWAALHPLAVALVAGTETPTQTTDSDSSEPPKPSRRPTAGAPTTSTTS